MESLGGKLNVLCEIESVYIACLYRHQHGILCVCIQGHMQECTCMHQMSITFPAYIYLLDT